MVHENPIEQFFFSIPPITRTYLTLTTVLSALVSLSLVSPYQLYLNFDLIKEGEWWRLFTNFLFFDKFSLSYIFYAYFLYFYCRRLEEHAFHNKRAEFLVMILFGAVVMLIAGYYFLFLFLSQSMTTMILYIWSRKNPTEQFRFYGLFLVPASYVPYVLLGLTIILEQNIWADVLGLFVGHMYYYLSVVLPITLKVNLLPTPQFLKKLFGEHDDEDAQVINDIQLEQNDAWEINHED